MRYIGSDLVLDFVFVPSDKFTCRFVGFALASPLRKGSSFGCEVINVYFTCGIGIMLQLEVKDG